VNWFCDIHSVRRLGTELVSVLMGALPEGPVRRVVVKPNWVSHETDPDFPIHALVTSTALIDATIEACIRRYASLESVLVADVPLQSCDWSLLTKQAGIDRLMAKYGGLGRPHVTVRDLRMNRVRMVDGYVTRDSSSHDFGDPLGYCDVILDDQSFLDPVCQAKASFRVSDYSPEETQSSHRKGFHRYRISRSLLECDLFINMAKMKTHQKAGITGALKNLVGINGNKAYLVHYKAGRPGAGGDEFPPDVEWPVVLQTRVRHWAQGRSRLLFEALQTAWRAFRRIYGIEVRATRDRIGRRFLISGGSWYGNDSIWRMIYDLNRVLLYGRPEGGVLAVTPQRQYVVVVDGITAGEGNGPLQPLPVETGIVAVSDNPFIVDLVLCRLMGFDYRKIPQLSHHREFGEDSWGDLDPSAITVRMDGEGFTGIESLPVLRSFLPSAGWRGHIEREATPLVA